MQEEFFREATEKTIVDARDCPWVRDELGKADFGDSRLTLRFLVIAKSFSMFPQAFINQASEKWSKAKAAYRFFDNDKITEERVLKPHYENTAKRINIRTKSEPVLIIQDTSYINLNHMVGSTDLGSIGPFPGPCTGLIMHTSFAVTERGLPLGIINQEIWARKKDKLSVSQKRNRTIEERESYVWIKSLRQYQKRLSPEANVITIGDRGSDIYELFLEALKCNTQFVVRARCGRLLANNECLWQFMKKVQPAASYKVLVSPKENVAEREACVEVRFSPICIPVPKYNTTENIIDSISAYAVYVTEVSPPAGTEPVEWMLITNVAVNNIDQALTRIDWYTCRWMIEVFHKVVKSGCYVEYCRLETNARRFPFLAMKSIIAWKLLLLTYFQRVSPNESALALLSKLECKALYMAIHESLPDRIRFNAKTATRWLASLGGFLGRKCDNQPGVTAIWRGWHRLQDFSRILAIALPNSALVGNR